MILSSLLGINIFIKMIMSNVMCMLVGQDIENQNCLVEYEEDTCCMYFRVIKLLKTYWDLYTWTLVSSQVILMLAKKHKAFLCVRWISWPCKKDRIAKVSHFSVIGKNVCLCMETCVNWNQHAILNKSTGTVAICLLWTTLGA